MTDKADKTELKPCPFCGSTNVFLVGHCILCDECAARGPSENITDKSASGLWDHRTASIYDDLVGACKLIMADYERIGSWGFSGEALAATRAALSLARGETP